ncbi:MAG: helix-turn-helix transcriptional regulator [Rhodocyclaceae bacterium]|nr:helix-turn-helix transcriptional regulator [Rhodocyclaceae bacterium]
MTGRAHALGAALGKRIAERRKALGWTQAELAERLSVDTITISRFERGSNLPSLARLELVAGCLQVSVSSLLSESSGTADDQALMIKRWIEPLAEEDRRFLVEMVCEWSEFLKARQFARKR